MSTLAAGAEDGVAAQILSSRRRTLLLTDEALRRVDATLDLVEAKADGDLVDAYASGNVLAVDVRSANIRWRDLSTSRLLKKDAGRR